MSGREAAKPPTGGLLAPLPPSGASRPPVDREKELSLGAFGLREPSGVLIVVEREE